jgi:hypothetical protein
MTNSQTLDIDAHTAAKQRLTGFRRSQQSSPFTADTAHHEPATLRYSRLNGYRLVHPNKTGTAMGREASAKNK